MPESTSSSYFVREIEIESEELNEPLRLYQKSQGDVNCIVWDAAIVLGKYLEKVHNKKREYLSKVSVLELGAGVGCVGLMAACLGANVTLTDLPENLSILNRNIEENKSLFTAYEGAAKAIPLTWGKEVEIRIPDKILLADCVYYAESIDPLIQSLRNLSSANTEILQSQEMRDSERQREIWRCYISELKKYFNIQEVHQIDQHPDYSSDDIKLYRIHKIL